LSGGMQHAANLGAGWRADLSGSLRGMDYEPLDITELDMAYAKRYGQLYFDAGTDVRQMLKYKANIRQHFIHADLELIIKDSDAVILFYDESVRKGAGTISEAQVAFLNDVPLFLVSDWGYNWKEVPGWLQALTTKMFAGFLPLLRYLDALPAGILKRDMYGNHGIDSKYLCSLCGGVFEKQKHHFVSKVSPTYCSPCVELITETHEGHKDRYTFMQEYLKETENALHHTKRTAGSSDGDSQSCTGNCCEGGCETR